MKFIMQVIVLLIELSLLFLVSGNLGPGELTGVDHCFCKLKGQIGDCSCNVDTVDYFNNVKIYPRLRSLLQKDYFRFYKVNLNKECPFWSDDSRCAMRFCHVKPCKDSTCSSFSVCQEAAVGYLSAQAADGDDIPPGLKGDGLKMNHDNEDMHIKYLENSQNLEGECDTDVIDELGYLNTTISAAAQEDFALWQAHDDAQDNFCTLPDEDGDAQYVDLSINPERYTGYRGPSAHRVWRSIYMENCFRPKDSINSYIPSAKLNGLCLEKRVFYRVISGLHASINIHLCSQYLFPEALSFGSKGDGHWGPNLAEFKKRFDPETTNGEGPTWLRNLYFLYLLELRAVAKAMPYLAEIDYYTGREIEDIETRKAIIDFLGVVKDFPDHFNESTMFNGGAQAHKLKEEFKQHFRNISRIMDCVGCEKCKLWGKLQTQGLGTALKILFSGKFDLNEKKPGKVLINGNRRFQLERSEIVALFNALGRLSTSIYEIEHFRSMMR